MGGAIGMVVPSVVVKIVVLIFIDMDNNENFLYLWYCVILLCTGNSIILMITSFVQHLLVVATTRQSGYQLSWTQYRTMFY